MSWFLVILFLTLTLDGFSEARIEKKLPSAVVVGSVFCDTCFQDDFSKTSHFISGATIAVECKDGSSKPGFREVVKTNKKGKFRIVLPFSVSKHVKKIEGCSVKLIKSSEPYCAVASSAASSSLHLKSRKKGMHIFSAGFFTFKPLNQPNLCSQKPSFPNTKNVYSMKNLLPPFNNPVLPSPTQTPSIPNIPNLPPVYPGFPPLPPLPQLPPLPPLPLLPPLPILPQVPPSRPTGKDKNLKHVESSKTSDEVYQKQFLFPPILPPNPLQPPSVLPPNPLLPPPLIPNPFQPPPLIPNPLQPPAPPLIPNPFQPPPTPLLPLPPLPFLTPPPPPPSLFPPFPFPPLPPLPRIPGFPPGPPREKASPLRKQSP